MCTGCTLFQEEVPTLQREVNKTQRAILALTFGAKQLSQRTLLNPHPHTPSTDVLTMWCLTVGLALTLAVPDSGMAVDPSTSSMLSEQRTEEHVTSPYFIFSPDHHAHCDRMLPFKIRPPHSLLCPAAMLPTMVPVMLLAVRHHWNKISHIRPTAHHFIKRSVVNSTLSLGGHHCDSK